MPPTKRGYKNTSGVISQDEDGIHHRDGNYTCLKPKNGGEVCGSKIKDTKKDIQSHNSSKHKENSAYQHKMTPGNYPCYESGCNHRSPNFEAIKKHLRSRHDIKGTEDEIKIRYGLSVGNTVTCKETPNASHGENPMGINQDTPEKAVHQAKRKRQIRKKTPNASHGENPMGINQDIPEKVVHQAESENDGYHARPSYDFYHLIDPALLGYDMTDNHSGDRGSG
ncbi:hypothetical protein F5Y03DRAFT_410335 [Xylaria venustula]|nr:hypothetical protein F5Y03DRAFT_410335 [Xylaria venustula]